MTEKELLSNVIETAHIFGWRVAHFRSVLTKHGWMTPVQADGEGFPDLVLVRDRVIFAELKVGYNKPTSRQVEWLKALEVSEAYLWTDKDWLDGTIPEVLKRAA